jgi:hypothetical protein
VVCCQQLSFGKRRLFDFLGAVFDFSGWGFDSFGAVFDLF